MSGVPESSGTPLHKGRPELVLCCGSRGWTDIATIARRLDELHPDSIVIHGGADGADKLCDQAAKLRGLHTAIVYARWQHFGRSAGHRRNAAMLRLKPDRVLAFSVGTPGTQSTIDQARRLGIPVEVVGVEQNEEVPA